MQGLALIPLIAVVSVLAVFSGCGDQERVHGLIVSVQSDGVLDLRSISLIDE